LRLAFRRKASRAPKILQTSKGSCLAYGTPEQPRGCAFERMRRLGNRGQ
jgi:hypothetical protein